MSDASDLTAMANRSRGGFNETLGLRFVRVTTEEVVAEVPVGPHLLQPYGLVHGGVLASMVETLCSVGAAIDAMPRGQTTVGLENSTSFLRATRSGTLRGSPGRCTGAAARRCGRWRSSTTPASGWPRGGCG